MRIRRDHSVISAVLVPTILFFGGVGAFIAHLSGLASRGHGRSGRARVGSLLALSLVCLAVPGSRDALLTPLRQDRVDVTAVDPQCAAGGRRANGDEICHHVRDLFRLDQALDRDCGQYLIANSRRASSHGSDLSTS